MTGHESRSWRPSSGCKHRQFWKSESVDYDDCIASALKTEGGHLSIGRGGFVLYGRTSRGYRRSGMTAGKVLADLKVERARMPANVIALHLGPVKRISPWSMTWLPRCHIGRPPVTKASPSRGRGSCPRDHGPFPAGH